jgi:ATP-binding cassette, subfamily C, bacterial
MKQIFKIFFQSENTRPFLVLISLLVASAVEAIGIGALLPAATAIVGQEGGSSPQNEAIRNFIQWLGINPTFDNLVLLIAAAVLLKSFISFFVLSYAGIAAAQLAVNFRKRLIAAMFGASWRFYAGQHSGQFANAVSSDATKAGDAYLLAAQVVASVLQAIVYAGIALFVNWKLALASLIVGTLIAFSMNWLIRISKAAGTKQIERTADLTVSIVDMMSNIKPLKTMHRHDAMLASLGKTLKRLKRALITSEFAKQGFNQGNDAVVTILVAGTAYLAYTVWKVSLVELLVSSALGEQVESLATRKMRQIKSFRATYRRSTDRRLL